MNSCQRLRSSVQVLKWIGTACAGVMIAGCTSREPVPFQRTARVVEPTTAATTAPSFASILDGMMIWDTTTSCEPDSICDISTEDVAMTEFTPACDVPQDPSDFAHMPSDSIVIRRGLVNASTETQGSQGMTQQPIEPLDSMAVSKPMSAPKEPIPDNPAAMPKVNPTAVLSTPVQRADAMPASPKTASVPQCPTQLSTPTAMPTPGVVSKATAMPDADRVSMQKMMSAPNPIATPSEPMKSDPIAKVTDEQRFAAEAEFSAGHLAQTENRLDAAVGHFSKALSLNSRYPAAAFRLGVVHATMKQYDQAIDAWWNYVRLTNESAESYACLGYCFELAGKTSEAEAAYKRGIARDMRNQLCRVNYGLLLARLGREDEALAQLTVSLSAAEAHYNIGSIYELQGRYELARTEYRRAKACDSAMWQADARLRAMDDPRHAKDSPANRYRSPEIAGTRE